MGTAATSAFGSVNVVVFVDGEYRAAVVNLDVVPSPNTELDAVIEQYIPTQLLLHDTGPVTVILVAPTAASAVVVTGFP